MFKGKQFAGSDLDFPVLLLQSECAGGKFHGIGSLFSCGRPTFAVFLRDKLSCVDLFDKIRAT